MEFSEKNMTLLYKHPLFDGIDRTKLHAALEHAGSYVKRIDAGEIILSPESKQRAAGLILGGKAVVTTPDKGKSVLLRYLGTGDLFGIANLFTEEDYVSVIRASAACKVFYIPEGAIRYLLENDNDFLYRYLGFLSGRICYLNKKIGYLTAGSAERRLALYLASLESNPVTLPLSISSLSEVLDIGRASLYRAFERLTADGFISKEGRVFYLSDTEAMLCAYH